jgi:hypothetical protein
VNSSTLPRPTRTTTHRPPLEFAARPGESPIDTARRLSASLAPARRFVPTTPLPAENPLAILGPGGDFTRSINAAPPAPDAGAVAAASVNERAVCDATGPVFTAPAGWRCSACKRFVR